MASPDATDPDDVKAAHSATSGSQNTTIGTILSDDLDGAILISGLAARSFEAKHAVQEA